MRVAVLHNLQRGGAHRRLREQVARLDADLVEVCLATADPVLEHTQVIAFAPRAPALPRALRVPVRYVDFAVLLLAWRQAAARVRKLGVDVVFVSGCRYLQAPAALVAAMPPSLYFCDEPRRVDYDPSAMGSRNPITGPIYAAMYNSERRWDRRAVEGADMIATHSAFTAAEIQAAYGRPATVVPLGISDAFRRSGPGGGRPGDGDHVLSVGTLIPSKGHDLVIEAVAQARTRRRVVIVAPRPDPDEEHRLRALVQRLGVRLELRFGITDAQLGDLYAGAFATVYMAQREPFGLVSLEAQAAGSPVIVAAEGGLPETLGEGERHWAIERNASTVAARLDELEDPRTRTAAVAAGKLNAARWTWQSSADRVQQMLSELARCGS